MSTSARRHSNASLNPVQTQSARPPTPNDDEYTEEGAPHEVTPETNVKKLSAVGPTSRSQVDLMTDYMKRKRERLDNLSRLRTYPNAINIPSKGICKKGGKAEVVQATFRPKMWSPKKPVAVKKLGYHNGIDKHEFSNVSLSEHEHRLDYRQTLFGHN